MKTTDWVATALILLYGAFWLKYIRDLSVANEAWYQQHYVNQEIRGRLTSITENSNDHNQVVLVVKNTLDNTDLTYGTICMDAPFRDYISVGDSVAKNQGTEEIFFCKDTGDCKQFKLDFCR